MRVLICPDKFKGSLSALEVCNAIAEGVRRSVAHAVIEMLPIADGGEGTVEAFCTALGGEIVLCDCHDPLGRPITAFYGNLPDGSAVVELPAASGFRLVQKEERDPLRSNTFGTGEILLAAARAGAKRLIVGLGGSATNDAGAGMAAAIGYRFLNTRGEYVEPLPRNFKKIARILPPAKWELPACTVLCDVDNPLFGPNGATRVFGPQKGVRPEQIGPLESALVHLAKIAARDLGTAFHDIPGAGAAGGMGFGMLTFARGELLPGFEIVANISRLARKIGKSDLVITGEGCLDSQSKSGKGPWGVAAMAKNAGKKVICIPGSASDDPELLARFDRILPLVRVGTDLEEAIQNAAVHLEARAFEAIEWMRNSDHR